ncbi:uncharacterized protein LOC113162660 [Anabas testudineus]|uniref:uncharacterized protein LOC113162660 n=1 Tax=Anabas testudineus TaxID=64144 RepID=UPI000E45CB08|nr:uncharacterized protein LOC113162660 [Anabas testudineus]
MDLRTAVTLAAFLLMTADVYPGEANSTAPQTHGNESTPISSTPCSCPNHGASTTPPSNLRTPVLGFLSIKWTGQCEGDVILHHPSASSRVCHESVRDLLQDVCKHKKGCTNSLSWKKGGKVQNCSHITEAGAELKLSNTLKVQCTVETSPDIKGQLQTYRVMTALLSCVLVIILLIRFTRPTVQALQRRLSDRRQNRWIGPTQSHSVSYHRGKTVKNDEGEKRFSYPRSRATDSE